MYVFLLRIEGFPIKENVECFFRYSVFPNRIQIIKHVFLLCKHEFRAKWHFGLLCSCTRYSTIDMQNWGGKSALRTAAPIPFHRLSEKVSASFQNTRLIYSTYTLETEADNDTLVVCLGFTYGNVTVRLVTVFASSVGTALPPR